MLSHLNRCEDCYLTWEQLSVSVTQSNQDAQQPKVAQIEPQKYPINCFNTAGSWRLTVLYLALICLVIGIVVNTLVTSCTNFQCDPSIAAVTTIDSKTLLWSINQLPIPWKDQTIELSSSTYTVPAIAFGAGLWSARNALMNSNDPLPNQLAFEPTINWQESKLRDYYALGRLDARRMGACQCQVC